MSSQGWDNRLRLHNYRSGGIASNFERIFRFCYLRYIKKDVLERQLKFFSEYASNAYKQNGFIIKIPSINVDDFKNHKFSNRAIKWFRVVIPIVYLNRLLNLLDLNNLVKRNGDSNTAHNVIRILEPFLDLFISDLSAGRNISKEFVLSFQKMIFVLLGIEKDYKENVFDNYTRLYRFRYISVQNYQSRNSNGIDYEISPPKANYDLVVVNSEDVMALSEEVVSISRNQLEFEDDYNLTLSGKPKDLDDVIKESCICIPISLLTREEIRRLIKLEDMRGSNRKKILTFINSRTFKRLKWNILLESNGTPTFFLSKNQAKICQWLPRNNRG